MKQGTDLKNKCAKSLKAIAPNLTAHDKQEAADKFGVHKNTVLNYLRGKVVDTDLGLKLLEFFQKKLNDRIGRVHRILAA